MKNKTKLITGAFIFAAGCLVVSRYHCTSEFWQSFLVNLSTSFIEIGVGLIVINIYLERDARKGAVTSLLLLSNQSLAEFHNLLLDLCWARFGRDDWNKLVDEYMNADGKPEALKQSARDGLYEIFTTSPVLQQKIQSLENAFVELSRMAGWDLDAQLLKACLDTRISIGKLQNVVLDGSDTAKNKVTEYMLDIDLHSGAARSMLMELAGIEDDE